MWGVDYEWIKKQYAEGMMEKPGMTVSRWIDGILLPNDVIDQGPNLWPHGLLGPRTDARPGASKCRRRCRRSICWS